MNLRNVMFIPVKNAAPAGQGFTAQADAPQTLIIQRARSRAYTNTAVSFSKREWNVQLWLPLQELSEMNK